MRGLVQNHKMWLPIDSLRNTAHWCERIAEVPFNKALELQLPKGSRLTTICNLCSRISSVSQTPVSLTESRWSSNHHNRIGWHTLYPLFSR
jgi:hypothetical protein